MAYGESNGHVTDGVK